MGQVGLGDDDESRGLPVEAMDDAGAALGPAGERGAARHERVDEGVVPVTRRRMHHQSGRLVDDGQILILVHDLRA